MGTFDTKLLISQALVDLCQEQPLKKVSISDIVERTGKNRKTFYYHFEDKNALIIWKFRYDLGTELQRRFPEKVRAPIPNFPFTSRRSRVFARLIILNFSTRLPSCLNENETFICRPSLKQVLPPCAIISTSFICPPCATT